MTYTEIFDDIVSIMQNDSATCKDKGAGSFAGYRTQITDDMPEEDFVLTVQRYLASFQVQSRLAFLAAAALKLPFTARRLGDALFVLEADAESGFCKGDKIIALDSCSIPAVAKEYAELFCGEPAERQLWGGILRRFSEAVVENSDGTRKALPIRLVKKRTAPSRPAYEFTRLSSSASMISRTRRQYMHS